MTPRRIEQDSRKVSDPERQVAIGDRVKVNLHHGYFEEGTVKAVVIRKDGMHYQIDLGADRTALVHKRQIRRE